MVSQQGSYRSIQYFSCKAFAESKPSERLLKLKEKGFCVKCLRPGMKSGHKGACYYQYNCPHKSHGGQDIELHVLLCESHCKNTEILQLLERYKVHIMERLCPNMDSFSRGIKITNCSDSAYTNVKTASEESGVGIFKLQTINIEGNKFNVFYDGGCGDLVCNNKAIAKLVTLGRASLELPGPFILTGVGDIKKVCKNGMYQIRLPLAEVGDALMSNCHTANLSTQ